MSQPKPKYLELTEEEQAKVARARNRAEAAKVVISQEHMVLAELGFYFGWEAVRDVIDDVITIEAAVKLLEGAREIYKTRVYDSAVANLAGRSPVKGAFEKLMKPYASNVRYE